MKAKYLLLGIVILVLVVSISVWRTQKEKTREDCYRLSTNIAVAVCLSEVLKRENGTKSSPVISVVHDTPKNFDELYLLSLSDLELEPYQHAMGGTHYRLLGVLQNNSAYNLKNIKIDVNFYKKGDDPQKFQPVEVGHITLGGIEAGKSLRFREQATYCCIQKPPASNFTWNWKIVSAEIKEQ